MRRANSSLVEKSKPGDELYCIATFAARGPGGEATLTPVTIQVGDRVRFVSREQDPRVAGASTHWRVVFETEDGLTASGIESLLVPRDVWLALEEHFGMNQPAGGPNYSGAMP